jgi:hypothetical protein
MLSPVMMLFKPALLSYRDVLPQAALCGTEAQMLPVLFTHFPAAYGPQGE